METVKNCPFCDTSPLLINMFCYCQNEDCPIYKKVIKIEKWDIRPIEEKKDGNQTHSE